MSDLSLLPQNLIIIPGKKNWTLVLDVVVITDVGNIFDVLFCAARIALLDTRVPRTSPIEYKAPKGTPAIDSGLGFSMRREQAAVDFEIKDYWDEGEPLKGADRWPVAITVNLASVLPIFQRFRSLTRSDRSHQFTSWTPQSLKNRPQSIVLFCFFRLQMPRSQDYTACGCWVPVKLPYRNSKLLSW